MKVRILTWGLFLLSCAFWAVGWFGAFAVQARQLPNDDSVGVVGAWGLGAFFGGLWLLVVLIRIAARVFWSEKTRAAAS